MSYEIKVVRNNNYKKLGIETNFTSPVVFLSTYTTNDTIKSWLINYFSTYKGERYMNPNLGNDIFKALFENSTDVDDSVLNTLKARIEKDIFEKFPELEILDMLFIINDEEQELQIVINFLVKTTQTNDSISFNISL